MKILKIQCQKKRGVSISIKLPVVRKLGFTLIELLIVIAIIGILATIIVVSYVNAQSRSRDNKRRVDVNSIASALQIYHDETKKWHLPGTNSSSKIDYAKGWPLTVPPTPSIKEVIETSKYLSPAPNDPKYNDGTGKITGVKCPATDQVTGGCWYIYMVGYCSSDSAITVYAFLENMVAAELEQASKGCCAYLSDQTTFPCSQTPDIISKWGYNFSVTVR